MIIDQPTVNQSLIIQIFSYRCVLINLCNDNVDMLCIHGTKTLAHAVLTHDGFVDTIVKLLLE